MRSEQGMAPVQVMVAMIIVVSMLATLGTYVHFSSATHTAQERSALSAVAQREIERLRPLGFDQLALTAGPPSTAAADAPLTGAAARESLAVNAAPTGDGVVLPGGEEFTHDGVRMRVYRYVTYRQPTCDGLTPELLIQLAGRYQLPLATLQGLIDDACALGISTTKRITVIAVPVDDDGATARGVSLSTVRRDPESLPILDIPTSALSVEPVVDGLTQGGTPGGVETQTQTITLLDTRCSETARMPAISHETRDTAQMAWTCSESGPAPKLMTLAGVPGAASDPVPDFSTDVTRAATGGLALLRDTRAGSCSESENIVYSNAEATTRMHSMHKWASTEPPQDIVVPAGGGRASLTVHTSTADGTAGPARLCATLQTEGGATLGWADFNLRSWPARPTELTTAFDIPGGTIPGGQRLVLTLRVPADSGEDLRVLYDHPAHQSALSFTTESGRGLG